METKTRILAADSNKDFCRQLTELIAQEGDMEIVGTASDGVETLALLSEEKSALPSYARTRPSRC